MGPEVRAQLAALLDPTALGIMAGVLVAWVVSHAFGIGEVIDTVVAVLGAASIGWAVFDGIDHLHEFTASGADRAGDGLGSRRSVPSSCR